MMTRATLFTWLVLGCADSTQPTPTDTLDVEPWAPSCRGRMSAANQTIDPCEASHVQVLGAGRNGEADLLLRLDNDADCSVTVEIDDLCGTGRVWIGGGAEGDARMGSCNGADGPLTGGWLDIERWELTQVDGQTQVGLQAAWQLDTDRDSTRGEITLEMRAPLAGSIDFRSCSNTPATELLQSETAEGADALDVLFVIDSTGSMRTELTQLTAQAGEFFDIIDAASSDWHIGVLTTESDGRLLGESGQAYFATGSPSVQFEQLIAGIAPPSDDARGRRLVHNALTAPLVSNHNQGFYRPDANLAVVTISNTNDQSANNPTRNEYIDFIRTLKRDIHVDIRNLVGPADDNCATAGVDYIAVANALQGLNASICDEDFRPVLQGLEDLAPPVPRFQLSDPVPGSMEVRLLAGGSPLQVLVEGEQWVWERPFLKILDPTIRGLDSYELDVSYALVR